MRIIAWVGLLGLLIVGCVPAKRVNLFQDEWTAEATAPTDSVLSTYRNLPAPILLQPGDIISVKVGSLTPSEYDFVKEYQARLGILSQQFERTRTIQAGNANQGGAGGGSPSENPMFASLYGFQLRSDGILELPYIGGVNLTGMGLEDAEKLIRDSLSRHFKSPIVRVEFLNFNFSVMGEVGTPGRYITYSNNLTMADAILMAGNFTEFSDRAKVKVIRNRGGLKEVFYINMLDENTLGSPKYYLQPGDMVVIGQIPAKASRLYSIANAQFFTSLVSSGITLWLVIDRIRN